MSAWPSAWLAATPEFRQLQQQVVDNAVTLAAEQARLRIPLRWTDTHMLLVDCKSVRAIRHEPRQEEGYALMGDTAARLDLAGIVCNRNTIPGDKSAHAQRHPPGTPWVNAARFPVKVRLAAWLNFIARAG